MIIIGFPITVEEACRLLHIELIRIKTFYHTEPIQTYLKEKNAALEFHYIDKGTCAFGIPLQTYPPRCVGDTTIDILHARRLFLLECKRLGVELHAVEITFVEEEPFLLHEPEPYVLCV
jgi:hypothetical protein